MQHVVRHAMLGSCFYGKDRDYIGRFCDCRLLNERVHVERQREHFRSLLPNIINQYKN